MKKRTKMIVLLYVLSLVIVLPAYSQASYTKEQLTLTNMLCGRDFLNLQKAIYAVENAYYNDLLNEQAFNQ